MDKKTISKIKKIVLAGLLLALTILLSRFLAVKTATLKISFGYIPVMLSGIILGPSATAIIDGLSDLIGATFFPFGPYFVGYTISAVLNGLIYGLLLHKRFKKDISNVEFLIRLSIATFLCVIVVNGGLNTLWISMTGGKAFWVLIPTRLLKEVIMLPIQIVSIFLLERALRPAINRFFKENK